MFRELASDIYVVEQPFQFFGLDMGARMTIVRRKNGDLWVHAPFAVSQDEENAIKELGHVRDIVVPNNFHYTQVGDFSCRFSDATVWALPELESKLNGVPHTSFDCAPEEWNSDFHSVLFDGAKGFREWTFCHRASKTLLITDLGFRLPRPKTPIARIVSRLNDIGGKFGPSRFERTLIRLGDKARARHQIEIILGWEWERIAPGHGFVVERHAKRQMRAAYRFVRV